MKKLSDIVTPPEKGSSRKQPVKKSAANHRSPRSSSHKDTDERAKRRRVIIIVAIALVLAIVAITIFSLLSDGNKSRGAIKSPNQTEKPTSIKYYSPLTGREVSDQAATKRLVLAVMIENSPEARPQSSLKEAGVVFEAVAEGGITRFIALYQDTEPSLIGPVRSLRPYYLEWAAAFSPAVVHAGGSPQALTMVRSGNYGISLDQSANGSSFWRTKDRRSPHNVYTDYSHLSDLAASKGKTYSEFAGLTRRPANTEPENDRESATAITIAVSTGQFAVSYAYDPASKTYARHQGNVAHQDREKGQIAPDVVIALRVNQTLQSDHIHNTIATVGSGECFVFQDGTVIKGSWHKDSPTSQIKFLDESSQEIKLARGQTWITAIQNGRAITWK